MEGKFGGSKKVEVGRESRKVGGRGLGFDMERVLGWDGEMERECEGERVGRGIE